MNVNIGSIFKNLDGTDLQADGKPFALSVAITTALMQNLPGESPTAEQKVKYYQIALKCYDKTEVELSVEDLADIKRLIGKVYGALIVGQAYDLLERGRAN